MMPYDHASPPAVRFGLSARLLGLTIVFVMLAEVLIYVPSISRFREVYLADQLEKANIAVLAARANTEGGLAEALAMDLLFHAGAYAIVLKSPDGRVQMLSGDMPPAIDVTFDMRGRTLMDMISEAFATLAQPRNRIMRVVAAVPGEEDRTIEVVLDETPLRERMYGYSARILSLSIVISLIAAGLVYFSLQWLMVRPIRIITDCIMGFRRDPEDEALTLPPTRRTDEIGIAQRELAAMQTDLRAALRQRTHLAALGAAVARINHDLRNTLATAVLASDRLAAIDDPEVKQVTPRLFNAIDRAVTLCTQTLRFVHDPSQTLERAAVSVGDLFADVQAAIEAPEGRSGSLQRVTGSGLDLIIDVDRDQMFRVFSNLALNAGHAGARTLAIVAVQQDSRVVIDVTDDGSGIAEDARARLFRPFEGASRQGGTGLGLPIAREIVHAHGGDLSLAATGPQGTTFRIVLPTRERSMAGARGEAAQTKRVAQRS
ncbi:MAG: HAMP domain-containing histidine kinase [Rhodospirillales bacterium]|nr:HAMP domain-containing histidine kinase [Rhodospirillales bacterium]